MSESNQNQVPIDPVDAIIARWAPQGRAGLLPCLEEVQETTGWLSPEVSQRVAEGLHVPLADVYGVVTFYTLLYEKPVGRVVVRVCDDIPCFVKGSEAVLHACKTYLGIEPGETTPDGQFTLEVHPCLGHCERAPFMTVNEKAYGPMAPVDVARVLEAAKGDK